MSYSHFMRIADLRESAPQQRGKSDCQKRTTPRWHVSSPRPGLLVLQPETGKPANDFEEQLLSHVDLCYSVAFALTRNSEKAQRLAYGALWWALQRRDELAHGPALKHELLRELRNRYIRANRESHPSAKEAVACGSGECLAS